MRFRLILKQSLRDFKSKLQLYTAFTLFLIVAFSMIIGLLTFFSNYSGAYNHVFTDSGFNYNLSISNDKFKFLNKNASAANQKDAIAFNYPNNKYLQDNGEFQDFIYNDLVGDGNYSWGGKKVSTFFGNERSAIEGYEKRNAAGDLDQFSLINYLGSRSGYADYDAISWYWDVCGLENYLAADGTHSADLQQAINPKNLLKNFNKINDWTLPADDRINNMHVLTYLALIKLNRDSSPSFADESIYPKANFYNGDLMTKFIVEKAIGEKDKNKQFQYGLALEYHGSMHIKNSQYASVNFSMMPGESWMDKDAKDGLKTPTQYQKENTQDYYIEKRMDLNKLDPDFLANRLYCYLTPATYYDNHIKMGDIIEVPVGGTFKDLKKHPENADIVNNPKFFNKDNDTLKVKVVGTAMSRKSYFRPSNDGVMFLPVQVLNMMSPRDDFVNRTYTNLPSGYYSDIWTNSWTANDKPAKMSSTKARNDFNKIVLSNFWNSSADTFKTIDGRDYNPGGDVYIDQQPASVANSLFRILCYVISAVIGILTIVVFWFVATETIKLQKNTLWFLKALGCNNLNISILTTLNVMVPLMIGAILSIFGSLFVTWIMNSAVATSYCFHFASWSFNVLSLVVLICLIVISFVIFLAMNMLSLTSGALSLHSNDKVGWVTALYMKTKGLYKHFSTGARIGVSFIVQNIFKNVLTLILLLLSFTVVLFVMQFSSAATASAHSYENRNKPYSSVMLDNMNSNDAISFNDNYLSDTLGINFKDSSVARDWSIANSALSMLFGQGYSTNTVSSYNDDERSIARQIYKGEAANAAINTNVDFNGELIMSTANIGLTAYGAGDPVAAKTILQNDAKWSLKNRYLTQSYMADELLNSNNQSSSDVVDEIFKTKYQTTKNPKDAPNWWPELISNVKAANGGKDPTNLEWNGQTVDLLKVAVDEIYNKDVRNKIMNNIGDGILAGDAILYKDKVDGAIDPTHLEPQIEKTKNEINYWFTQNDDPNNGGYKIAKSFFNQVKSNFKSIVDSLRSEYSSLKTSLGNNTNIPFNVYFDRSIAPVDTDSVFATQFSLDGWGLNGIGLDPSQPKAYSRIVQPNKQIAVKTPDEIMNSTASYKYNENNKDSVDVHYIDAYISGKMSSSFKVNKGDIIAIKAQSSPNPDMTIPTIYFKIDKVIPADSAYSTIYFNKQDYLNYLSLSMKNNWDSKIAKEIDNNNQEEANSNGKPAIYNLASTDGTVVTGTTANINTNKLTSSNLQLSVDNNPVGVADINWEKTTIKKDKLTITFNRKVLNDNDTLAVSYVTGGVIEASDSLTYQPLSGNEFVQGFSTLAKQAKLENNKSRLASIGSSNPYELNNSVYSYGDIPYSLSHLTLTAKVGIGYSLFDYIQMPVINYSSAQNSTSLGDNVFIFRLVTAQLMGVIKPIVTTMHRFVALLLVITFVVAVILIELVLLQNRQTIILFKAMGYRKREVNFYLLGGYIIADVVGLVVGVIVSHFVVKYASAYTLKQFNISLYPVWTWAYIVTAVLMAIIFMVMIFGAVTWYTNKQKPRDAFNTL